MLLGCLAIIWTAVVFGVLHRFLRSRATKISIAAAPFLIPCLLSVASLIQSPPKADAYLARFFPAPMPTNATNTQIRPSSLPDPGHLSVYLETSLTEIAALRDRLQMSPLGRIDSDIAPILFRIPKVPEPNPAEMSWYIRTEPSGTAFILATKDRRVFLARFPGYSKSENELKGNPAHPR
jgi:hypothetical protein